MVRSEANAQSEKKQKERDRSVDEILWNISFFLSRAPIVTKDDRQSRDCPQLLKNDAVQEAMTPDETKKKKKEREKIRKEKNG